MQPLSNHVYRRFNPREDISSARVHARPHTLAEYSQSLGGVHVWLSGASGTQEFPWLSEDKVSLYGGVRSRVDVYSGSASGLQVYPVDIVDTHSIDKVIGVPGQYPQTGSINVVLCTDTSVPGAATDTRWYDEHWSVVSGVFLWHSLHGKQTYRSSSLPATFTAVHIPEMFYGRQVATGSVYIWTRAWETASGSNVGSGTRYWVDDGLGRLFDVPSASIGDWRSAWMSGSASLVGNVFYDEGLIVLTNPSASWHDQLWSGTFASTGNLAPAFHLEFDGSTIMQSMVFMCRLAPGEVNGSNNPTYSYTDAAGKMWAKSSGSNEGQTYITAIGVYNEERQLVAVAKLAQPIRKRERDNLDIRLRLDV